MGQARRHHEDRDRGARRGGLLLVCPLLLLPLVLRPLAQHGRATDALATQLQDALAAVEPEGLPRAAHGRLPAPEPQVRAAREQRDAHLALPQGHETDPPEALALLVGYVRASEHLAGADHVVLVELGPRYRKGHSVVALLPRLRLPVAVGKLPQLAPLQAAVQASERAGCEPRPAPEDAPLPRLSDGLGEFPRAAGEQPLGVGRRHQAVG
mmetsp:Transcript_104684/g.296260  ORF Transcript_104684/g.296260 Transcript_104684/m.296260 type:complete len:211 (+) Transcript_104684:1752-2384(+)